MSKGYPAIDSKVETAASRKADAEEEEEEEVFEGEIALPSVSVKTNPS